ncbi:MAG: hypothetical protein L7F78_13580 [Syntrophales bacterium LBB04]|nr:hypothetical protein [Syntrophales bacterium LBB04]
MHIDIPTVTQPLFLAGIAVLFFNLPFGFWRAQVPRFSRSWFMAIHIPIPFVICIRIIAKLGWHPITFPVMIGSFLAGQFLGGAIHALFKMGQRMVRKNKPENARETS